MDLYVYDANWLKIKNYHTLKTIIKQSKINKKCDD